MSDSIITRSFPVSALIKEKKIGSQYRINNSSSAAQNANASYPSNGGNYANSHLSTSHKSLVNPGEFSSLHDGLQMRSSTFQLIKVFFDEEVLSEKIDRFRHALAKIRYPPSVLDFFCFGSTNLFNLLNSNLNTLSGTGNGLMGGGDKSHFLSGMLSGKMRINDVDSLDPYSNGTLGGNGYGPSISIKNGKEKSSDTIRHFAKNTLRKAGLMSRSNNRKLPQSQPQLQSDQQQQQAVNFLPLAIKTPEVNRKPIMRKTTASSQNAESNRHHSMQLDSDDDVEDDDNLSVIDENFDFNINNLLPNYLLNDPSLKHLEKILENSSVFKDFSRQGLLNSNCNNNSSDFDDPSKSQFRLCTLNINYQFCKSYPAMFLVPKDTTDECIRKNAKCHRQNRLPIMVWRHPVRKSVLLRSSGFHGKGFIGMLIKGQTTSASNEANSSIEHDKYINEIIRLTKSINYLTIDPMVITNANLANHLPSTSSSCMQNDTNNFNPNTGTPITNRRSLFSTKIEKAVQTIKHNYQLNSTGGSSNDANKFNTIASVSSSNNSQPNSSSNKFKSGHNLDLDTNSSSQVDALNESFTSSISSHQQVRRGAPLYILCEKSQVKSLRSNADSASSTSSRYIFIPVETHDVKDTKNSFKKLCRACVPSTASNELINEMQQFHSKQQNFLNNKKNSNSTLLQQQQQSGGAKLSKFSSTSNSKLSRSSKKMGFLSGSQTGINQQFNTNINYHHGVTSHTHSSQHHQHNHHNHHQTATTPFSESGSNGPSLTSGNASSSSSGFFKQIQDSKWFDQLQLIINMSNLIVERIEEASSVMVALEDGWDLTSQVTCIAQLMLDPYYRTLEGFSVLVEREWLSMGHRFSRRSNQTADDQTGFAPIFLQFLDVVHQCLNQNLNAFEFNEFYLEFLAYHYVSNRFKTFLLDSEMERLQFGIFDTESSSLFKQQVLNTNLHTNVTYSLANSIPSNTTCIWQYILKVHYNSAKFFNFNYQPTATWQSLRVSGEFYKLKLWRYFTKETLCTGPIYDLDLLTIGNLNSTNTSSTSTQSIKPTNNLINSTDDFWYPVPVQNASDFYEQLDQILPTQYEVLLKQIMRKYKLTEVKDIKLKSQEMLQAQYTSSNDEKQQQAHSPSSSIVSSMSSSSLSQATTDLLNKLLNTNEATSTTTESNSDTKPSKINNNIPSSSSNSVHSIPLNWKNVWDYFYQMVENKLIKEIVNTKSNENEKQTLGVLTQANKLFESASENSKSSDLSLPILPYPHSITKPYLSSSFSVNIPNNSISPIGLNEQSKTNVTQQQTPPPFPKLTHHQQQQQQPTTNRHDFETFIFSSINSCHVCQSKFKSSSQFIGRKCRKCSFNCHEQCLTESLTSQCGSGVYSTSNSIWKTSTFAAINGKVDVVNPSSACHLDTSIYSIQTTSSCSTTPNSQYSHHNFNITNKNQYLNNNGRLDMDIGSVCAAGLNATNESTINNKYSYTSQQNSIRGSKGGCAATTNNRDDLMSNENSNARSYVNWSGLSNNEHQTYAGYLRKRGALFKQWNERYFVLDSVKHQLRYYETANDSVAKGVIDLSDVESINQGMSASCYEQQHHQNSSTKKALNSIISGASFGGGDNSVGGNELGKNCFELKTSKRIYYFCAKSPQDAYKWIKQLEMCFLDS
jgi:hypothetical protein